MTFAHSPWEPRWFVYVPGMTRRYRVKYLYNIHQPDDDISVHTGTGVYSTDGICPPFASANSNIFDSTFGIKFNAGPGCFICPLSPY